MSSRITADLAKHLLAQLSLTNLVSDRIYSNRAPDDSTLTPEESRIPYLILNAFSGEATYTLTGEAGITQTNMQIACWNRDPTQAAKVAATVRNLLSAYRGEWNGRRISACILSTEPNEVAEEPDDGRRDWFHAVVMDYQVTHDQAVPTFT